MYHNATHHQPQHSAKSGMMGMVAGPLAAAAIGGAVQFLTETSDEFRTPMAVAKYAAIVGGSNFVATRAVGMVLPEFHNEKLRNVQHISLGAAGTAFANILGQRYLNRDSRVQANLIAGAAAGGGAPLVSSAVMGMW